MRRKRSDSLLPPHGVRALVPVFAVQGGAGRSTVTGLLAQVLAPSVRTVVIDTAPRSSSPWADWLGVGTRTAEQPGLPGLAGLGRTPDRAALIEAKLRQEVPVGRRSAVTAAEPGEQPGYDVLADTRPWTRPPGEVPEDPRWHARLVESGGWFAGLVDIDAPAARAHIEARTASRVSMLDRWFGRQDAVPLLVASSSAAGPSRLQRLTSLLDTDGLVAARAAVAIVDVTGADRPKWLAGELEALAARVGLLVQVPFDKTIHASELTRLDGIAGSTLSAVRQLAEHIMGCVRHHPTEAEPSEGGTEMPGMAAYRAEVQARQSDAAPTPAPPTPAPPPQQPAPAPQQPGWVPDRRG